MRVFWCLPWPGAWAVGGGGFANQIVGTRAMGMGNAFVAVADDPSAVFFNPAGLTNVDGTNFSIGFAPHIPSLEYENGPVKSKVANYTPVVPNLYVTTRLADSPWAFGFGVYTHFGLKVVWPFDGPFNYVTTESDLILPHFNPTVSYKVNDKLSVGGGLVYAMASAELKSALPIDGINIALGGAATGAADGEQIMDGDGDGFGATASVMYRPNENHSVGLTWRSDLKVDIKGDVLAKGFVNESASPIIGFGGPSYSTKIETAVTLPPSVILGYAYRKGKLTWALDGEWMGFSSYRSTEVDLQTRMGYTYYPNMSPEANWDPSVPDSSSNGLHIGGTWARKSFSLDLSYSYLNFKKARINNTVGNSVGVTVNGTYDVTVQIISMNLNYRI
ncbi:MAG: outer membrane protein transport protein [Elusimicrobia bacterium]|nr:outer membrane protein transport protein [Elusimicrobiota bacterium]